MEAALNGPNGRIVLGATPLTIGRTPDNQLVVNDAKASSHHAEIRPDGQGYSITDLGSTNGTFVNGQRLIPHMARQLNNGDAIRIGDTQYNYEGAIGGSSPQYASTVYAGPGQSGGFDQTIPAAPPPAQPQSTAYGRLRIRRPVRSLHTRQRSRPIRLPARLRPTLARSLHTRRSSPIHRRRLCLPAIRLSQPTTRLSPPTRPPCRSLRRELLYPAIAPLPPSSQNAARWA
jgi:predicted component of type VI protein secretion system